MAWCFNEILWSGERNALALHDSQCKVGRQAQHDGGQLVGREVLKVQLAQLLIAEFEHALVDALDPTLQRHHTQCNDHQQAEVDGAQPAKEYGEFCDSHPVLPTVFVCLPYSSIRLGCLEMVWAGRYLY